MKIEKLLEGLLDGTIDCIATDHAPHAKEEKEQPMTKAPFGIVGSETAFPLLYTHFVRRGNWSLQQLVDYFTIKPATIFNLNYGKLHKDSYADLTIIDLNTEKKSKVKISYLKLITLHLLVKKFMEIQH